jgi:hypothetical protein
MPADKERLKCTVHTCTCMCTCVCLSKRRTDARIPNERPWRPCRRITSAKGPKSATARYRDKASVFGRWEHEESETGKTERRRSWRTSLVRRQKVEGHEKSKQQGRSKNKIKFSCSRGGWISGRGERGGWGWGGGQRVHNISSAS